MLPDDSTQALRLRREREIPLELGRELYGGDAGLAESSRQLLAEGVRERGGCNDE